MPIFFKVMNFEKVMGREQRYQIDWDAPANGQDFGELLQGIPDLSRLSRPCAWTRRRGCIGAKAELNVMEAGLYTDTVRGFPSFSSPTAPARTDI